VETAKEIASDFLTTKLPMKTFFEETLERYPRSVHEHKNALKKPSQDRYNVSS